MARTANPNKEKIVAVKAELKEHARTVRLGETAAKKHEKLTERLAKLTGTEVAAKPAKATKAAKTDKPAKKGSKVNVAAEKKAAKVVVKKKGRPAKKTDDDED